LTFVLALMAASTPILAWAQTPSSQTSPDQTSPGQAPSIQASPAPSSDQAQDTARPIIEQGKFTLHKFEQPIGEETYQIRREGDAIAVKIDFKFTDRGSPVPLSATFRGGAELTPQSLDIEG